MGKSKSSRSRPNRLSRNPSRLINRETVLAILLEHRLEIAAALKPHVSAFPSLAEISVANAEGAPPHVEQNILASVGPSANAQIPFEHPPEDCERMAAACLVESNRRSWLERAARARAKQEASP